MVQLSHPYMTTGNTIALTIWTFVSKVMSMLFNMLSRLVIACLPRSKRLLISWLWSPSAVIFGPPKIKSVTISTVSPPICHEVTGPDAMILAFWMLSIKPTFSLSSFTFIKKFFSSLLSAIRVVLSPYLRLLMFLPAILIPAWTSTSLAFHMMYSSYKLKKAGWWYTALTYSFPNLVPVCCSMSSSNCCFLTCIQISQVACKVIWHSHLLKNFPQFVVIHTHTLKCHQIFYCSFIGNELIPMFSPTALFLLQMATLNKYITFSVVLFSKGTWYLNSRGTFMWLCLYWLVVRSVTDHVFWHTSLKAQSAAFKTVPGGLPYRDFWWCLYYFEIKRILHTAVQKHSWNQLLNHLLHLGYTWCTCTWWRLLKTWVVSSRSL